MDLRFDLTEEQKNQLKKMKQAGFEDVKLASDFVEDNTEAVIGVGCAVAVTALITGVVVHIIHKKKEEEIKRKRLLKALKKRARKAQMSKAKRRKLQRLQEECFVAEEAQRDYEEAKVESEISEAAEKKAAEIKTEA